MNGMEALRRQTHVLLFLVLVLVLGMVFAVLFQQSVITVKSSAASQAAVSTSSNRQNIAAQMQALPPVGTFIYGKSGLGTNLTCMRILPEGTVNATFLMTFEIHGFEDAYPKDGQVLVNIGDAVAQWAANNRVRLGHTALYLVASANPDGLADGVSNNGKGRCQISLGVNINRDFPTDFTVITNARDHTLSAPLAAPESLALTDLVESIHPTAVLDVHGWEDHVLGNQQVSSCFLPVTSTRKYGPFDAARCHGFFSLWASTQGAKAALLELPKNATIAPDYYISKIENGVETLVKSIGG